MKRDFEMILNERTLNNGLFKRRKASEDIKGKISDWDIWECADPTFSYAYDRTVTMYVHEGAAALTFSNGETVDLQSGDTLTIQSGAIADWIITAPVRNSYVYHDQRLPAVNLGP